MRSTGILSIVVALTLGAAVFVLTLGAAGAAHAQGIPNTVPPTSSAGGPPPAAGAQATTTGGMTLSAPSPSGATSTGSSAPVPGGIVGKPEGAPADQGLYLGGTAEDEGSAEEPSSRFAGGNPPDTHVVRTGDTLWDICTYYFNNPWQWPKVWSYNPTITNPHWIYPGDVVRLYPAGQESAPVATGDDQKAAKQPSELGIGRSMGTSAGPARNASLRQIAFVDDEELKYAGTINGSPEEKVMLSPGDEVYVDYPEGKPPQIGQRYAVYSSAETIKHPESKEVVGAYITLHGEVRITEVKKGRRARAMLTYATDVIERGMRVGPTRTQFKDVAPRPAERDLEGVIIAMLGMDQIIGERMVIFIDRGADDGLKPGNQMRVLRRGDAYVGKMGPSGNAGQDDRRYPDNDLGQIIVVEVGKKSSIAFVTHTNHEVEIGDHVVMRTAR
jgi:hypothetical protein